MPHAVRTVIGLTKLYLWSQPTLCGINVNIRQGHLEAKTLKRNAFTTSSIPLQVSVHVEGLQYDHNGTIDVLCTEGGWRSS